MVHPKEITNRQTPDETIPVCDPGHTVIFFLLFSGDSAVIGFQAEIPVLILKRAGALAAIGGTIGALVLGWRSQFI